MDLIEKATVEWRKEKKIIFIIRRLTLPKYVCGDKERTEWWMAYVAHMDEPKILSKTVADKRERKSSWKIKA